MEKQESVLDDGYSYEIKFIIPPEEYVAKANEELKRLRKKLAIPGFRPGHVPFHLARKLVGEQFLYDTVLKMVEDEINKIIKEKKEKLVGDPLVKDAKLSGVSWNGGTPAEITFLLGVKPEVQLPESLNEPITFPDIEISDRYIDEYLSKYAMNHGSYEEVDNPEEAQYFTLSLHLGDYNIPFLVQRDQITDELINKLIEQSGKPTDAKLGEDILIETDKFWADVLDYVNKYEKSNELRRLVKEHQGATDLKISLSKMEVYKPLEINLDTLKDILFPRYAKRVKDENQAREFLKEQLKYELLHLAYRQVFLDLLDKLKDMLEVPVPEKYLLQQAIRKVEEETDLDEGDEIIDEEIELEADRLKDRLITDLIVDALLKKFDIKVNSEDVKEALAKHLYFKLSESEDKEPSEEEVEDLKTFAGEIMRMGLEREDLWYERVFLERIVNALLEAGWVKKKPVPVEEFVK